MSLKWTQTWVACVAVAAVSNSAASEIQSSKDGSQLLLSVPGARLILEATIDADDDAQAGGGIPCGGPLGHPGVEVVNGQCVPKQDVAAMTKEMIRLYIDSVVDGKLKVVNELKVRRALFL
jgi:hypothetical protein